ncbi:MAG: type II toxin-antitoxin system Phd/YefM family antitoxin [Deltaproteobacteria bacterium]|nr:type II toxin-antitoxin system Phd/YefM family antitoxin [Deltaproteobacteria bacterium]
MKDRIAVEVGVRELKNRLTTYLKLVKADREVIVTERGKPVAVLQSLRAGTPRSLESRVAALAARGEVTAPQCGLAGRVSRVRVGGVPLSRTIVADRR